jgi:dihydroorotate dehydrogenase electron transfer subunit
MAQPTANDDGTITAIIADAARLPGEAELFSLWLPAGVGNAAPAGRFFLARCGPRTDADRLIDWSLYRRRTLYVAGARPARPGEDGDPVQLVAAPPVGPKATADPGYAWLRALPPGAAVNLMGPLGRGFQVPASTRNLLLVADLGRVWLLLPLIEPLLDRGGRVTLLVRGASGREEALLRRLPMAVEVYGAPGDEPWRGHLDNLLPWADQVCAALPAVHYRPLAEAVRQRRFRLTPGFASALVEADFLCGYGACLACAVPRPGGGYTRACVHGPVFDLAEIA